MSSRRPERRPDGIVKGTSRPGRALSSCERDHSRTCRLCGAESVARDGWCPECRPDRSSEAYHADEHEKRILAHMARVASEDPEMRREQKAASVPLDLVCRWCHQDDETAISIHREANTKVQFRVVCRHCGHSHNLRVPGVLARAVAAAAVS